MLDVCPVCRIQAAHRPERTRCPRCGGPLTVVDEATGRPMPADAVRQEVGQPAVSQPVVPQLAVSQPAVSQPAVRQPAVRPPQPPATGPLAPPPRRTAPVLRWTAHRPADTLPAPRIRRPERPRGVPRYPAVPAWGLSDVPAAAETVAPADPAADLSRALGWLWPLLTVAAGTQLLRYLTLVTNRSRPVPFWWDVVSVSLLSLCGYAALLGVPAVLYLFGRWVLSARQASFAAAGRSEPRRRLVVLAGAALFPVNLVTAPLLLREPARAVGGTEGARAERAVTRAAVAWALVCVIGLIALGYRIAAAVDHSVQTGADAMAWAVLGFAASAAFAAWLRPRLSRLTPTGAHAGGTPARRLVVAA